MTPIPDNTVVGTVALNPGQIRPDVTPPTTANRRVPRMAWLWFGPLVALGLLHFWLDTRAESLPGIEPIVPAPYVQAAAGHDAAALRALVWQASQPLLITLAALALIILLAWAVTRRWGLRRAGFAATGLWCVICTGLALVLAARYVNHAGLVPLPPVTATVIAVQSYPSTDTGSGGALAWLQPPDAGTPWRVRFQQADARAMPKGAHITLQRARGALWGLYLTGSDAPQAQPLHAFTPDPAARATPPSNPAQSADSPS
jgi:hypothetical protein